MEVQTFLVDMYFDITIDYLMDKFFKPPLLNNMFLKSKEPYTKFLKRFIVTTMTLKYLYTLIINNIIYF